MSSSFIQPERLRAFFAITALFHLASIASAFPDFEAKLPAALPSIILWAQFPVLLFGGYLQGRTETREKSDFALWMRLDGFAKYSFAFAVSYLFVVIVKAYEISLGTVDPLQSPGKDLNSRLMWYGIWSVMASTLLVMGPVGPLVSILQALTAPARRLPAVVAILLVFLVGISAGYGAIYLISSSQMKGVVVAAYDIHGQVTELIAGVSAILGGFALLYRLLLSPRD